MADPIRKSPDEPGSSGTASPVVVSDATCTGCGCLCDDIELAAAGGRIVEARHACELGRRWFLADHDQGGIPSATVAGRAVAPAEALDRAAEILREAKAPVVLGLTRTSNEAVAAALAVADRIGAAVDVGDAAATTPGLRAFQRIGRVSATLGEVKNRADLVVYWGVDPVTTHPRHWERYAVEPVGRFVPEGRAGRSVIVADSAWTATAEKADWFVRVAPETTFETLWTLHALTNGRPIDPDRVSRTTGLSLETLRSFADRLRSARYGAWFHDARLGQCRDGSARVEAALALVRDLNAGARFVILPLGGPGNTTGAQSVLASQAGFAQGVDFSGDSPRSLVEETSAAVILGRGEADAALIVADDVESWLSASARAHLGTIPRVVVAPRATADHPTAAVALSSATPAIDAPGTVTRIDGVVLPLRPPLVAPFPSDREWLSNLNARLNLLGM